MRCAITKRNVFVNEILNMKTFSYLKTLKTTSKRTKRIENVESSNSKLKFKLVRKTFLQNNIKLITFEIMFQIAFEKLLKLNLN